MHSIRSAARKQAWYYNDDPENRTYNIFGRPNPYKRRYTDPEKALTPVLTDSTLVDGSKSRELKEYDETHGIRSIKKAYTSPTSPTSGPSQENSGRLPSGPLNDIDEKESEKTSNESNDVHEITPATTGAATDGARQRHRFHLPFGKKDQEHDKKDDDLSRTQSRKSRTPQKLTWSGQFRVVLMSWINVLLVFVPIGLAFEYAHLSGPATFVMNFIAIIPLASMLSFATEELSYYVGETFGGLLNASFGNATELIVSIIALSQGKIVIVQTSLIGSILSNLLLVLGMCFLFGGLNRLEQFFNITVAQTASSLLALAIGALVTPTAFRIFSPDDTGVTPTSRAASVLLLFTYVCYLFFQLRTHTALYNAPSQKTERQRNVFKSKKREDVQKGTAIIGAKSAAHSGGAVNGQNLVREDGKKQEADDEDDEQPQLGKWFALATLAASTALIAVTSDGMVSAIDSITEPNGPLSEEFVGLKHATAVTVAIKDKMDLAIGVAVGSSLQIALLVIPVMVIISWAGLGHSVILSTGPAVLDLNFDGFQVVVLFIAIILVNYVIQDGSSHWLEGVMLMITYIIFAVAAWYYPASSTIPQ